MDVSWRDGFLHAPGEIDGDEPLIVETFLSPNVAVPMRRGNGVLLMRLVP